MNLWDTPRKQQEDQVESGEGLVIDSPIKFPESHSEFSSAVNSRYSSFKRSENLDDSGVDHSIINLLARIQDQDREAFRQFYDLYAERIGSFLLKKIKNPDWVDEAVNDVMLAIWQHAGEFDPNKGKFTTWLFGITLNKGLKICERTRRYAVEQPFEAPISNDDDHVSSVTENYLQQEDPAATPEQTILAWELLDALNDGLNALSSEHREILELIYSGDYSYQEIADLLGCPTNTIKTRVFHARKNLVERLKRKGFMSKVLQKERWL
jgi:RNA polymerase sigma-70 factor (ECF subfamily)